MQVGNKVRSINYQDALGIKVGSIGTVKSVNKTEIGVDFGDGRECILHPSELEMTYQPASTQGTKNDQGKARMDLLSPVAVEQVAQVLAFGAKKYADHNWRKGLSFSRVIGSLLRHSFDFMRGVDVDAESGLPQTAHIMCNAMFLCEMWATRKDLDDRFKLPKEKPSV